MKTISLLNMKGGVAKTTTSLNVAVGLAMKGLRVLLVDFDPQANCTAIFMKGSRPEITIDALIKEEVPTRAGIIQIEENLWFIPSSLHLQYAEIDLRAQPTAPQHDRLLNAIKQVEDDFDYCIIDCPPIINLLTVNAIIASNLVIVPIKPDIFALEGFSITTQNINQIRKNWKLDLEYKILFAIVNKNNEEREIIRQLRVMADNRIFKTEIRSQPKPIVKASSQRDVVIRDSDPKSKVADDYRRLVDEILGE